TDQRSSISLPETVDTSPIDTEDSEVLRAREWLQADAERLQRSLTREEVERVAHSLKLDVQNTAILFELLETDGLLEACDETEPTDEGIPMSEAEALLAKGSLRAAFQLPLLTADEERMLGRKIALGRGAQLAADMESQRRIAQEADQALARLAISNLRLVLHVARAFAIYSGEALEDLFQDGIFGLLRACEKFDPDYGTKFSTYAMWWIRQSITRAIADKGRTIRLPIYVHLDLLRYIRAARLLRQENNDTPPSVAQIANELAWDVVKARFIGQLLLLEPVSLDTPAGDGEDKIGDFLMDPDSPEWNVRSRERLEIVQAMLDDMDERTAYIIRKRFGLDDGGDGVTLEILGRELNVTRERIRQIESEGLRRLRIKASIAGLEKDDLNA
ncbi:sigma-70 family RNA polymerase sigma factor, partial [Chromobacterium vaccinii]|uniref:sigma-70 family RNA polymerase sigma factor n=1 Tax=Chromobacterium vaccinii TaxID=1108595 RepID=UPI003C765D62